mmetsp:Transcript_73760/g.153719  ORF Transcript_73760/g.153719 Transcript_73760/m.153719 type:complete len:178 (+) Transcript_73760:288-821(+)|eukprot:CAMPEP_0206587538 /NCGR_PEP_ID=MMETSP0325_2-20121206/37714_1 /ASSEMBLY_ACC=CAM_ASM_000347 /TAXON_ID=2866 /ORGANISM="Crypthecodinium cohnii, Strain Seligo" /LENGTH=177 /DNA_ID=CAMNT_0054095579 /DNA_START=213 /DNA_END=746 /DNA_ORIENTATION=+
MPTTSSFRRQPSGCGSFPSRGGLSQTSTQSPRSTVATHAAEDAISLRSRLTDVGSRQSPPSDDEDGPRYTAWARKSLEDEVRCAKEESREAKRRATALEQELKTVRAENVKLRRELEIQRDRDSLLRELRESSRASDEEADRQSLSSQDRYRGVGSAGGGVCRSFCLFFGRQPQLRD